MTSFGKNIVERGRPQMTIRRMRIVCWISQATNTQRLCNTRCFSTAIKVARTRLCVRLHLHCLSPLYVYPLLSVHLLEQFSTLTQQHLLLSGRVSVHSCVYNAWQTTALWNTTLFLQVTLRQQFAVCANDNFQSVRELYPIHSSKNSYDEDLRFTKHRTIFTMNCSPFWCLEPLRYKN
jgi:hypothetical protein